MTKHGWTLGFVLSGALAVVACGHPEQRVIDQYFNAVNQADNQTLSSFAVVRFETKVEKWAITDAQQENKSPAPLPGLIAKAKDLDAQVAANKKAASAYALDHLTEVDQVRDAEKKRDAKMPPKLATVAAKWDEFNQMDRELKKSLSEAKDAVEREKHNVALSMGQVDDIEAMKGDMVNKDVSLNLTIAGQVKAYTMSLRKYEMQASEKGPRVMSRWVVFALAPKG